MRKLKNLLCVVCGVLMLCCAVLPVSFVAQAAEPGELSSGAFKTTDLRKETNEATILEIPVEVVYHQSEARTELARINALRTGDGAWYWNETDDQKVILTDLAPMTYDYALEKIAMRRAAELVVEYAHSRPNGERFYTAHEESYPGEETPYEYFTLGENIAYGYTSADEVQTAWEEENEPYSGQGHRRNILNADFSAVGCACVEYGGVCFWVQEFSSDNNRPDPLPANDDATVVTVDVNEKSVKSWRIGHEPTLTVRVGESIRLSDHVRLYVTCLDSVREIATLFAPQWKTDDLSLVAVENGVLTGVNAGSGRITGYFEMLDWTFTVAYQVTDASSSDDPSDPTQPGQEQDPADNPGALGDVDLDGKVTASDARLALRRAVNLDDGLTAGQIAHADVDLDGAVTAADARVILRVAVGLEVFSR